MKIDRTKSPCLPKLLNTYPNRVLLAVNEVAQILGLSKSHTYRLIAQHRLPFTRVGLYYRHRISIVEVARYMDAIGESAGAA